MACFGYFTTIYQLLIPYSVEVYLYARCSVYALLYNIMLPRIQLLCCKM
jgi:hypothetical protein